MSRDVDIDVQALAYLVTVMIHRFHEHDQAWWQEFRDDLKTDQAISPVGTMRDKVLQKAIEIVEHALNDYSDE